MSDGGFRPAYNVQFATDVDSHAVVGVDVRAGGSDQHHLVPMLDQVERRVGRPTTWLADGGYVAYDAIDAAAARDITLLMPVPAPGAPIVRSARNRPIPPPSPRGLGGHPNPAI